MYTGTVKNTEVVHPSSGGRKRSRQAISPRWGCANIGQTTQNRKDKQYAYQRVPATRETFWLRTFAPWF